MNESQFTIASIIIVKVEIKEHVRIDGEIIKQSIF